MDMPGMSPNASATSNSTTTSHSSPMMLSYLHFKVENYAGDYVLFKAWRPATGGQIAGAAIGLLFFAILERALGAFRARLTARWQATDTDCHDDHSVDEKGRSTSAVAKRSITPPFNFKHDLIRGTLYGIHAVFGYVLMLNVMSFQAAYIITICVGLGIGEMLFGRVGSTGAQCC